jgi:hypothetical protein
VAREARVIAYKFLRADSVAPFSGVRWPRPGHWLECDGSLEACANGIHASPPDALAYWFDRELWQVELAGEILDEGTVLVARRGRLVARVGGWPDVSSAFAHLCAERASGLAGQAPGNVRIRGLADEAAECAEEEPAPDDAIFAAYAAAVAADVLEAGSFASERAWQSRRLVELLGLKNS